jgi:hypothetical protein
MDGEIITEAENTCGGAATFCGSGGKSSVESGAADMACRGSNCSSPSLKVGLMRRVVRRVIVSPS